MNLLPRIVIVAALALCSTGLWASTRLLRGDLISFRLPPADHNTTVRQAMAGESVIKKGIELNPLAWQPRIQIAAYMALEDKYKEALDELNEAAKMNKTIAGMNLEATIYAERARRYHAAQNRAAEIEEYAKAVPAFQRLYRLSIIDRTVVQQLMGMYHERPSPDGKKDDLQRLAIETDIRWPGCFDTLVALGNSYISDADLTEFLPLILKYFVLAANAPQEGFSRPDPHVYELSAVTARVKQASGMAGYKSDWALPN